MPRYSKKCLKQKGKGDPNTYAQWYNSPRSDYAKARLK